MYLEYDDESDVDGSGMEKAESIVETLFMNEETENREAQKNVDLIRKKQEYEWEVAYGVRYPISMGN